MIRKPTLILLAVFVVMLAVAVFLQRTPGMNESQQTPSVTPYPKLLAGLASADVTQIGFETSQPAGQWQIEKNSGQQWVFSEANGKTVDAGKVEQLLSSLTSMNVINSLEATTDLQPLGLDAPVATVVLTGKDGESYTLHVGNLTPPETGYYLQLNDGAPVVADKYAVEDVLNLLQPDQLAVATPTSPAPMEAISLTPTP